MGGLAPGSSAEVEDCVSWLRLQGMCHLRAEEETDEREGKHMSTPIDTCESFGGTQERHVGTKTHKHSLATLVSWGKYTGHISRSAGGLSTIDGMC